ncbi:MAG: universal stress protein [Candidatus Kuenenia sp.]|nr:universal stress protein [Candidatus Kuenenia hertensis]
MVKIETILFPTDFSPCAEHALKYAITFATEHKAKLYILHVIPDAYSPSVSGPDGNPVPPPSFEKIEAEAKKRISQLISEHIGNGLVVEDVIVQGIPEVEIVKCARKYNIDLITMATHGRKGISHLLIGSTAEKVVQMAPCPVLTIKHPEHEFVLP